MSQSGKEEKGHGRMGGLYVARPGGYCICPNCSYREIHCPGLPCVSNRCPKCGVRMRKE